MNVFDLRNRLVADYAGYTRSFIKIADPAIAERVDAAIDELSDVAGGGEKR